MLEGSCIRSTTCFPLNRATLSLVILDYFSATYMLDSIFQLVPTSFYETGIISDGPTDTLSAGGKIIIETFSVKLGHLLLFLSLVFPFIRLQNYSPIYHLTSCLLFIEVDKGVNTSLRFVRYI